MSSTNDSKWIDVSGFINFEKTCKKEVRGGVIMYDIKGVYKYLTISELLEWYNNQNKNNNGEHHWFITQCPNSFGIKNCYGIFDKSLGILPLNKTINNETKHTAITTNRELP